MSDSILDYDYELPAELIAREPPERREDARLLVVDRTAGTLTDARIGDLPRWLKRGDRLVFNNTKVVPARLVGTRASTGAKWEGLFLEEAEPGLWRFFGKTRGKLLPGERIRLSPPVSTSGLVQDLPACELVLVEKDEEGVWTGRVASTREQHETFDLLNRFGRVPLPPYMDREERPGDRERYQTTFAHHPGSVAAPTAGLHFTPELLAHCRDAGAEIEFVTLHVGAGTFKPVTVSRLSEHRMHHEWCELSDESAERLSATREAGGRVIAIGTTSIRTLETASQGGAIRPFRGATNLFIRPPFQFQAVSAAVTNFHLPRSTLLVLVRCLAGDELIRRAYAHAIQERYRFFSYGDAMLIV